MRESSTTRTSRVGKRGKPAQPTILFDMASLRFYWDRQQLALSVFSSKGELLGVTKPESGTHEREVIAVSLLELINSAGVSRRLPGPDGLDTVAKVPIALYDPLTALVQAKSGTFSAEAPFATDDEGSLAFLDPRDSSLHLQVGSEEVLIRPASSSMERVAAQIRAHSEV